MLPHYINETIGLEELSRFSENRVSKRLSRMFGPKENPQASNLFVVISYLQYKDGIHLEVKARKMVLDVVWQCSADSLFGRLTTNIDNGIFHGIDTYKHRKTRANTGHLSLVYNRVGIEQ